MAMTKVKALQMWCKKMCEGYQDVLIKDMASSWKSGLAFCAIIHRFRPDLIDYDSLSPENVFDNNQLAFEVAETELGIPAFLEAADMVAIRVPDKLSIVTYVSQYYNYFHDKPQLGGPGVKKAATLKRHQNEESPGGPEAKRATPNKQQHNRQTPVKDRQATIGDKCSMCHEKVYLLERLIDSGRLYHRTCFRQSDLSPTSKIFKTPDKVSPERTQAANEPNYWQRRNKENENKSSNIMSRLNDMKAAEAKPRIKDWQAEHKHPPHPDTVTENRQVLKVDNIAEEKPIPKSEVNDDNKRNSIAESNTEQNKPRKVKNVLTDLQDEFIRKNKKTKSALAEPSITESNTEQKQPPKVKNVLTDLQDEFIRNKKLKDSKSALAEPVKMQTNSKMSDRTEEPMETLTSSTSAKPLPSPRGLINKHKQKDSDSPPPLPVSRPPELQDKSTGGQKKPHRPKSPPKQSPPTDFKSVNLKPTGPPKKDHHHKFNESENSKESQQNMFRSKSPILKPTSVARPVSPKSQLTSVTKPVSPKSNLKPITRPESPKQTVSTVGSVGTTSKLAHVDKSVSQNTQHRLASGSKTSSVLPTNQLNPVDRSVLRPVSPNRQENDKPPSKPPRLVNLQTDKAGAPSTDQLIEMADQMSSSGQPVAILVKPQAQTESQHDRNVLDGLLKNLANVRKADNSKNKVTDDSAKKLDTQKVNNTQHLFNKQGGDNQWDSDKPVAPARAKPRTKAEISDNADNQIKSDDNNRLKPKERLKKTDVKTDVVEPMEVSSDNIPSWKKHIEENKKLQQAKIDVQTVQEWTNDTSRLQQDNLQVKMKPARPKTPEIISKHKHENEGGKLSWQVEAEKRRAARQGGYTDPETSKTIQNKADNGSAINYVSKTSETVSSNNKARIPVTKPRELPVVPPSEDASGAQKKKIPLGMKFNFNNDSKKSLPDVPKSPPPRPPLPSPTGHDVGSLKRTPRRRLPEPEDALRKMSPHEIQNSLAEIDSKLTGLELRGRHLEDSIRKAQEEDENMMIEWFKLVNEKNELVRKEADLIYASRAQELETEQEDIDQRIRDLLSKPDDEKTKKEKREEEYLLNKKLDIVNQRNIIVDSQDEDRIRYLEEDKHIAEILTSKGFAKDK